MDCILCGASRWMALPVPTKDRSIATSSVIIGEPLQREQCMECGLLRKAQNKFLGNTRFYEEQYEDYYSRPGAAHYDSNRYLTMAEWMRSALGSFEPSGILDIGCGAGWSMAATSGLYKNAAIEGVEPSSGNVERARKVGFMVHSTRLGSGEMLGKKYDLVYANNVLQHVVDPVGFLTDISEHLAPAARVVFILPDADEPSNEMLWTDHNFSFRPTDLAVLARKTGFLVVNWQANPSNNNVLNKQLVILAKDGAGAALEKMPENSYSPDELFAKRAQYLLKWQSLDGVLQQRANGHRRIFNFGGSMWTWLLAGYCPVYWSEVEACLVDEEYGMAVDKRVLPPSEISFAKDDCIVLGVNPVNQAVFAERCRRFGANLVEWSDQITI
jgi:SAM-dependent methyltransferase